MLTGVAFCPQAPVLLPVLSGAAAAETDDVRSACDEALRRVLAGRSDGGGPVPTRVLVLAAGPQEEDVRTPPPDAVAVLSRLGAPATVPLDPARRDGPSALPTAAAVGAFLLGRTGWPGDRGAVLLRRGLAPAECAAAGAALAAEVRTEAEPSVLLVLGDGSACHGEKAPGYVDPDAGPYDDEVATALAGADTDALLRLDADRSDRLLVAGREAWQAAAAAVAWERDREPRRWAGHLHHRSTPYGVGYLVASWLPA